MDVIILHYEDKEMEINGNLIKSFALFVSGGLTVISIILPQIAFEKSGISRRVTSIYSALGVGISMGLLTYFGFSNGDLFGSTCTGLIAALTAGFVTYMYHRKRK